MENEETRNKRNWRYGELLTIVDTWVETLERFIVGLQTMISPSCAELEGKEGNKRWRDEVS